MIKQLLHHSQIAAPCIHLILFYSTHLLFVPRTSPDGCKPSDSVAWLGIHPLGGSAHGLVGTFAGATETRQAMRCGGKQVLGWSHGTLGR